MKLKIYRYVNILATRDNRFILNIGHQKLKMRISEMIKEKEEVGFKKEKQLSLQLTAEGLQVSLRIQKNARSQLFSALITSLDVYQRLPEHFENLMDLKKYMKEDKNVVIDIESKSVKIIAHVGTTKVKQIEIARIFLNKEFKSNIDEISEIIQRCKGEKFWTDNQTKSNIQMIAHIIGSLISQVNSLDKENSLQHQNLSQFIFKKGQTLKKEVAQQNTNIFNHYQQLRSEVDRKIKQFQNFFNQLNERNFLNIVEHRKQMSLQPSSQLQRQFEKLKLDVSKIEGEWNFKFSEVVKIVNSGKIPRNEDQSQMKQITKILEMEPERPREIIVLQSSDSEMEENKMKDNKNRNKKGLVLKWVHEKCHNQGNLILDGTMIHSTGSIDIFGTTPLTHKNKSFTVQVKRLDKFIGIGIIDSYYIHEKKYVMRNGPNLIYYSNNRKYQKYCNNGKQGQGFKQGQTIKVIVNFEQGSIEWRMENRRICWLESEVLYNNKITWVPYLQMEAGATVEIKQ